MDSTSQTRLSDVKMEDSQAPAYIKIEDSLSPSRECSPHPEEADVSAEDLGFLLQKDVPKVLPDGRVFRGTTRAVGLRTPSTTAQVEGAHGPTTRLDSQCERSGDKSEDEDGADAIQDRLDREDSDFKLEDHSDQDSDDDKVTVKVEKANNCKSKESTEAGTKRQLVRTAREYWQRDLQREKEAEEKKRKLNGEKEGPQKARKTSAKSSAGVDARNLASLLVNTLHSMEDLDESIANGSVPSMGSIQASSKRDQIRQMINSIPEECDTRRTKTQKEELKEAMVSFGFCNVEQANGKWRLRGIGERIESHQLIAAQWMVKREAKELSPAGGILADDTGMGKTVSTLACIVSHPPEEQDIKEFSNATLIVLPNRGMVTQWLTQIEKFCYSKDASDKTVRFSKAEGRKPQWWGGRWVVLTTYAELVSQAPKPATINRLNAKYKNDKKGFAKALKDETGPLLQVPWFRVVLDEGQAIKNRESSTAFACCNLTAKYRWVLTATPISNGIEEFYPYLKFIGCSFTQSLGEFKEQYITGEHADRNIRFIVSMVMLRRTHKDTFLGKKITKLPSSKCHDLWITPPNWELILSKAIDNQYSAKILETKSDDKKDAEKDSASNGQSEPGASDSEDSKSMTAQCTRMRQAASHPFNLEKFLQEGDRKLNIEWILEQYKENVQHTASTPEQKVQDAAQWEPFLPGLQQLENEYKDMPGDITDMTKLLSLVANEHNTNGLTCCLCEDPVEIKKAVRSENCEHAYCRGCLKVALKGARKEQAEGTLNQCPQDDCTVALVESSPSKTPECIQDAVKALEDFEEPGTDSIGSQWLGEGKRNECFFAASCGREDIGFDPIKMPWGAKLTATVQVILTWLQKSPDDKIIVFIEFTITAKALGCILAKLGLEFLYYNQIASTQAKKDKAYKEFQKNPDIRILVASMKCGGTGLNLQIANLVIIDDIWFNTTVEQQAFGRVHRIGQKKETKLVRILARGTIDERLVMLQDAKAEVVSRVLQDNGHEPTFSNDLQLRMLFTAKDKETMINDMEKAACKRKGKPRKTTVKASVKTSAKTARGAKKTQAKAKVTKKA